MEFKQYIVTLKHDAGVISILTASTSAEIAVKLVTDAEYAPMSAVISVEELVE